MSRLAPVLILIAGLALPRALSAQDFEGQWELSRETPRGVMTQILTLVQEAEGYTGTILMRENEIELEDVVVEGDEISFSMTFSFGGRGGGGGGGAVTQTFEGTLDGDEIKGVMSGRRGPQAVTLTRVKD